MAKLNAKAAKTLTHTTHEGAPAKRIKTIQALRRSVMACLLWEDTFYEDSEEIAKRIADLAEQVPAEDVVALAIEARSQMNLRHVPLMLMAALAASTKPERRRVVAAGLAQVIQRADELTEFLAIYWRNGRCKLSAQVKKGLARAFPKFNAYQLAKYNRDGVVKLRDVLFLCHAKPKDEEQAAVWKQLVDGALAAPDTWEVALSSGADKKAAWERLLSEDKLGALALLRNLRNMQDAGVSDATIRKGLVTMKTERVLPFRFLAAAKFAPIFEPELEKAMLKNTAELPKLKGKTAILVDKSGSMVGAPISAKSTLDRLEAASALAILLREVCEEVLVIAFGQYSGVVPARRGFALRDAIYADPNGGGTYTEDAKKGADKYGYDRIIIVTDEQSHQALSAPKGIGYVVNVAPYKNGVGYGKWNHIDGWSENIVRYITELEALPAL